MKSPSDACPNSKVLLALLEGRLAADQEETVREHAENCSECQRELEHLDAENPSMSDLARHLNAPRPSIEDALEDVVNRMKQDGGEISSHDRATSAASLDFLTPSSDSDFIGRLGKYEISELIGQGGMGIVLKAFDAQLKRVLAIKVLAPEIATNANARSRFRREAQAAAAVNHDHVVTIHAVDEANRLPHLVMEYVAGQSLQDRITERGPLEVKEILRVGMQTASGLTAAHAQGLVHRDIKPANILLENGVERVKITDFGLARAVDDVRVTQSGVVTGTPDYMSPEQAEGLSVDRRSDLFSLGCVMYAMCTGRPPFRAESTVATLRRVCDDTPRPIRQINEDIPEWLVDIVDGLLDKDPSCRFQFAAEVEELLGQHLAHLQQPSLNPAPPRLRRQPNRGVALFHRLTTGRVWKVTAAVFLLMAVGLAVAETTGVTNVRGVVIRFALGEGTLAIEVLDPDIVVTVDGQEVVFNGPGINETRWRPGEHLLQALKNGETLRDEHITITRGDRKVVTIRPEIDPSLRQQEIKVIRSGMGTVSPDHSKVVRTVISEFSISGFDNAIEDFRNGDVAQIADHLLGEQGNPANQASVWSRDSRWIAYEYRLHDRRRSQLRVASAKDRKPRLIYGAARRLKVHDWTPHGDGILCQSWKQDEERAKQKLLLISVETGESKELLSGTCNHARISPNGKYITFARGWRIHVMNIENALRADDGEKAVQLATESTERGSYPVWSLDGNYIFYTSDGNLRAIRFREGETAVPLLLRANWKDRGKRWSASGDFMFVNQEIFSDVYAVDVMGRQVSAPKPITRSKTALAPAWSPDGQRMAYFSDGFLNIKKLDSGQIERIDTGLASITSTFWSPDRKTLALGPGGGYGHRYGVYLYDLETRGPPTLLVPMSEFHFHPKGFIANGRRFGLFKYWGENSKERRNVAFDVPEGDQHPIPFSDCPDHIHHFDTNHDPSKIVAVRSKPDGKFKELVVSALDFSDGIKLNQIENSESAFIMYPRWSPNGKVISYVRGRYGGEASLHVAAADGSWEAEIDIGNKAHWWRFNHPPVWSPDGSRLAFALQEGPITTTSVLRNALSGHLSK